MPELPNNVAATPYSVPRSSVRIAEETYGPNSAQAIAARDQSRNFHPSPSTGLGSAIRSGWDSNLSLMGRGLSNAIANAGPVPAGVAGLGLGAGLGYGVGKIWDHFSDDEGPGWRGRLGLILGGLIGGGLGGVTGYSRKYASVKAASSLFSIQQALQSDSSLSQQEKSTLLNAVQQLPAGDIKLLMDLIRTASGAAVGALIARFLMKAGMGGMLLGALAGGFVTNRMGSGVASTLAGPRHLDKTDAYGNSYRY